jgi:hypothetical protein
MRYNLLVSLRDKDYGYGWEVAPGVTYPLGGNNFPYVLISGSPASPDKYDKKIPKEYT